MTAHASRHARPASRHIREAVYLTVVVVVVAAAFLGLSRAVGAGRCTTSATLVPSCGAWWGMYIPTASDSELGPAVSAEEQALGRPLSILERYHDMSVSSDGIFPDQAEQRLAHGHLFLFSWAPNVWSAHKAYPWRTVASGALDRSVIVPEAQRLRAFRHTVFLTFGAEADAVVPAQGTPADFVAAWRHVHDVFTRLGVRNVVWVWTTEGYLPHGATIAALYPGDAYVDWIGYDPYNYFTCHGTGWLSFAQTVTPFYRWLGAHGLGGKPVMLAEYGSVTDPRRPGREAAWYRGMVPVLQRLPRIKAVIQWNAAVSGCDLRLAPASAAGRAYRQAGMSPYFPEEIP